MRRIIGLAGKMYSGKSTIAKMFQDNLPNSDKFSFADSLKDLCCKLLDCGRVELDEMKSSEKRLFSCYRHEQVKIISQETEIPEIVISKELYGESMNNVRCMLQTIGTDVIRSYNPDWHVDKMIERINNSNKDYIIIDDVRFQNEKKMIERLGGKVFYIKRDIVSNSTHASETSLDENLFAKEDIIENKTFEMTEKIVKEMVQKV